MKPKKFLTVLLLAFVFVSVAFLVKKERAASSSTSAGSCTSGCPRILHSPPEIVAATSAVVDNDTNPVSNEKLRAIYFYGNVRCVTCKKIESFAKEAIEIGFADEIKNGKLEYTTINIDEPANQHYIQDYQLTTRSVILAKFSGGEQISWKNLERIWELVRDKQAFVSYVQDEAKTMMNGIN